MQDDSSALAVVGMQSRQESEIKYELSENEVLELYYTEPRCAAFIDPACGSSGFLVEELRYIWKKLRYSVQGLAGPIRRLRQRNRKLR